MQPWGKTGKWERILKKEWNLEVFRRNSGIGLRSRLRSTCRVKEIWAVMIATSKDIVMFIFWNIPVLEYTERLENFSGLCFPILYSLFLLISSTIKCSLLYIGSSHKADDNWACGLVDSRIDIRSYEGLPSSSESSDLWVVLLYY